MTPLLYDLYDAGSYGSAFDDITSGNNDLTGSNGGAFPATSGYDAATGIGSPLAAGLTCSSVSSVSAGYTGAHCHRQRAGPRARQHRLRVCRRHGGLGHCHFGHGDGASGQWDGHRLGLVRRGRLLAHRVVHVRVTPGAAVTAGFAVTPGFPTPRHHLVVDHHPRLLAGRLRRWHLHLWLGAVLRLHRFSRRSSGRSWESCRRQIVGGIGSTPLTAGSSRSAMPASTAPFPVSVCTLQVRASPTASMPRLWGWCRRLTAGVTSWSPPTAGCSPSVTPSSPEAVRASEGAPGRPSPSCPMPAATATGW